MRVSEEAILATMLYERMLQRKRAEGEQIHTITNNIERDAKGVSKDAALLKSMARGLNKLDCLGTGRTLTSKEQRRMERFETAIKTILRDYQLASVRNDDGRGFSFYIQFPSQAYNSMGGREMGWGI